MAQDIGEGSEQSLKGYTRDKEVEILTVEQVLADLESHGVELQPSVLSPG